MFFIKNTFFMNISVTTIYISLITFFLSDIVLDYIEDELGWHFYIEIVFIVITIFLLIYQVRKIYTIKYELKSTKNKLLLLQNEVGVYIEQEFNKWQLTNAEKSIAWLIIKGFSFKEIAKMRSVSGKTVHQQSTRIYQKSGMQNRHELMSGFLEEFINFKQ